MNSDKLEILKSKIDELISIHNKTLDEKAILLTENSELKKINRNLIEENKKLEEKTNNIAIAKTLLIEEKDSKRLKSKISTLIKDIDTSIMFLDK